MPTITNIADIAERMAIVYWQLFDSVDPSFEGPLDSLFDAVAELDALAEGISHPCVRALLDGPGEVGNE